MKTTIRFALTLSLLTVTLYGPVFAQSNTGRLVGTISDASGVIPGASVAVTDNQTGKKRELVASDDGSFAMPQLDPGSYRVTITAPGHKTFSANDVKIDVGKDYALNATLEVGDISENVEVIAGADVVNSTSGELTTTVSPRQIRELPLNGRDPTTLIQLQAGTSSNGATNTSVNGQRSSFTNITRDGINIQDNFIRANASDFSVERPNTDNVAEFTFASQNASADQGTGASQVQFVTPRGQNDFHGAAYIYNRNSKFAANEFFNNASGTARPFLNRNQVGGALSGPIWKNKIFFFGNFEAFRLRTQSSRLRTILLPGARAGNFTYVDNAGVTRTVNLFSQFGAATGVTGIDPIVNSRILSNLPTAGNTTDRGDQRNTTGFRFNQRDNTDRETYATRFDYDIDDKHSVSGVFTFTDERVNDRPDVDNLVGYGAAPVINQPSNRRFLSVAHRMTPTSNFSNEIRGGFFKSDPIFLRTVSEPDYYLTLPLISSPEVNNQNQGRDTNTYNIQDNANYQWGNHSLRFGGQSQFFRIVNFASFDTLPRYTLGTNAFTPALTAGQFAGGISAGQVTTANSLLALLGGIAGRIDQTFNAISRDSGYVAGAPGTNIFDFENHSLYFADQWRVSPRLTLNLGVRYELFTGLRERNGFALEPVIPDGADPVAAILNPVGTVDFIGNNGGGNKFFKTDKNNFAPVLSFAYSPEFKNTFLNKLFPGEGRTVIRGGFRMSYVNDEFVKGPDNAQGGNAGLSTAQAFLLNDRLNSLSTLDPPAFAVPRSFATGNALAGNNFGTIFAIDPNIRVARTTEYSIGITREIGFRTAIELRYVGARGDGLVRGTDVNQVDIINNGFLADFNRARQNLILSGGVSGAYNPAIPGSQVLTVFPNMILTGTGSLSNATIRNFLIAGTPADLAVNYITTGRTGTVPFLANPNAGAVDLLTNSGRSRYNSLQAEIRRRFSGGLFFQANYTFQKNLTNASGVGQTRFEPNLDNAHPELEYSRADTDQTHVFNFNGIYELPFGRGKRFLNEGGWINRLVGGFQFSTIVRAGSGAPLTFVDGRGTLNRVARSFRQTPQTSLTKDEIKKLVGVFRTPCGVFYINPSVININLADCSGTGRAAEGFGTAAFPGQVFFNNAPGEVGNLERAFINGPFYFNMDASIIKNIPLTESVRFQIRAEAFNVLNRANFFAAQPTAAAALGALNINSPTFGRLDTTFDPRIIQFVGRIEF